MIYLHKLTQWYLEFKKVVLTPLKQVFPLTKINNTEYGLAIYYFWFIYFTNLF